MSRMVDISGKENVMRVARARGIMELGKHTIKAIKEGRVKKGDVLSAAKVAGIQAVKDTPRLIPLCHQIPIMSVEVSLEPERETITCECEVKAEYRTGVEMEALVGVAASLLTVWDMVKYLEKDEKGQYPGTRIKEIKVISKKKSKGNGKVDSRNISKRRTRGGWGQ